MKRLILTLALFVFGGYYGGGYAPYHRPYRQPAVIQMPPSVHYHYFITPYGVYYQPHVQPNPFIWR